MSHWSGRQWVSLTWHRFCLLLRVLRLWAACQGQEEASRRRHLCAHPSQPFLGMRKTRGILCCGTLQGRCERWHLRVTASYRRCPDCQLGWIHCQGIWPAKTAERCRRVSGDPSERWNVTVSRVAAHSCCGVKPIEKRSGDPTRSD